jgi:nonsense-mediated mRNA decay protein 3
MRSICPSCGEPSIEGLCDKCSLARVKPMSCPPYVEVTICSVCGSKFVRGKWQISEATVENMALEAVHAAVAVHQDIINPELDVRLSPRGATRYMAHVRLQGGYKSLPIQDSCSVEVRIRMVACDRCSRMAGKYFESTIQIRGSTRPPTAKEIEESKNIALSMTDANYRRGDQFAFIQDIQDAKGGVDIILGSTQVARQISRAIYERFGGKIQESSKLTGKKDGNDIYRTTILVRFPRLKKGDLIKQRGNIMEVTRFEGKKIQVESIYGGRRSALTDEEADEVVVLGNRAEAKRAVVLAKDKKVVEFMDPETYKSAFASRPVNLDPTPGEEVNVVKTVDGFIILT